MIYTNKKNRYLDGCGFIDPKILPLNEDGFRACRYCKKSIKPPKRTFCSNECVHEYRLRSDGTYLRSCVFERDQGICAICNIDTKETADLLLGMGYGQEQGQDQYKEQCQDQCQNRCQDQEAIDLMLKNYNIHKKRKITSNRNGGGLWDADHIVPVKDGGGECGMDNIRTLCISCHKIITFSK